MQSSSQGRYQGYQGYQGYPYVNPIVTDVPSIDAETASRWANLPRKPIQLELSRNPGASGAGSSSQASQRPQTSRDPVPPKKDIDANPVVYIDLPETGSEVSMSIETPGSDQPEFVQETIMYDQFENRRIDMPKEDASSIASSASGSSSGVYIPHQSNRPNPVRPNTLNLASAAGSSGQPSSSSSRPTPVIFPGYMSKESLVYGGDGADGFPMSPIPVSEFPEPPPAYTEMAVTPSPPQTELPRVEPPPPRTQVIMADPASPNTLVGLNYDRKNMICHHCGSRVHTLVIREIGWWTHVIACFAFVFFMPFVILVYFMDTFKYKNHYCPNCNKQIGYVTPIWGQKVHYVN